MPKKVPGANDYLSYHTYVGFFPVPDPPRGWLAAFDTVAGITGAVPFDFKYGLCTFLLRWLCGYILSQISGFDIFGVLFCEPKR